MIEGKHPVRELIKAGASIAKLYIQKGLHGFEDIVTGAKNLGAKIVIAEKRVMDKISETGKHQGVIAEAAAFEYSSLEDILAVGEEGGRIVILLDGIKDPRNLGSILRVAECANVSGVVIPSRRSVEVNATVVKTSAGASNHIKVAKVVNLNDAIRELKDNFFTVVAVELGGESIYKAKFSGDLALVIGAEDEGVSALTKKLSDKVVSIPQHGKINSLNASVAAGIAVFEILRKR